METLKRLEGGVLPFPQCLENGSLALTVSHRSHGFYDGGIQTFRWK